MLNLPLRRARAFSLVELLVALAVVAVLAALLLPAFLTVRGKARETACLSNLHQIGLSVAMYAGDYDSRYPYAVDPIDRAAPAGWSKHPDFAADIAHIPLLHEVLQPYIKAPSLWACRADTGITVADFSGVRLDAFPTSYEKFGTSYYYRTELAARKKHETGVITPAQINMLFDGAGHWHGTLFPLAQRYNVLFADGHTKNVSREQIDEAWQTRLSESDVNSPF